MEIIYKSINELIPYDKNPRFNEEAVKYVANSIKEFGFKNPIIIDKNNVIVCGHTRLNAAKSLGLQLVPCIVADDLNEEQIRAFRIADNKVSEVATWDYEALEEELENILTIDMSDFYVMPTELFFENEEVAEATEKEPDKTNGLFDEKEYREILNKIKSSELSKDEKRFLSKFATTKIVFNKKEIKKYFERSNESVRDIMISIDNKLGK